MRQIVSEFSVDKYKVLKLDGEKPIYSYSKYLIDGEIYDIVPVYDMINCIAIKSSKTFVGKTVEFI